MNGFSMVRLKQKVSGHPTNAVFFIPDPKRFLYPLGKKRWKVSFMIEEKTQGAWQKITKQKLQPYLPLSYWLWVIQKQAEERLNQLLPTSRA